MCKARKYRKESSLLTLYYASIYPSFTYCNTPWGDTCSSFLEPRTKLQKRAIYGSNVEQGNMTIFFHYSTVQYFID